jgi:protein involved in temperature-dependent protein secretion
MMNEAIRLNPHSVLNRICLGNIFADARRWEEAIRTYDSVAELDSAAGARLVYQYWNVLLEQGRVEKARVHALQAEHTSGFGHHDQEWMLACVDAASGRTSEATRRLRELRSQFGPGGFRGEGVVDEICIARLYALLRMKLETVDWIERGFSNHASFLSLVSTAPEFDDVRNDPRVMSLLLKAGFVEP